MPYFSLEGHADGSHLQWMWTSAMFLWFVTTPIVLFTNKGVVTLGKVCRLLLQ